MLTSSGDYRVIKKMYIRIGGLSIVIIVDNHIVTQDCCL